MKKFLCIFASSLLIASAISSATLRFGENTKHLVESENFELSDISIRLSDIFENNNLTRTLNNYSVSDNFVLDYIYKNSTDDRLNIDIISLTDSYNNVCDNLIEILKSEDFLIEINNSFTNGDFYFSEGTFTYDYYGINTIN